MTRDFCRDRVYGKTGNGNFCCDIRDVADNTVCNGDVYRCAHALSAVGDAADNTHDGVSAACPSDPLRKLLLSIPMTTSRQVQKPKVKVFCESSLSFSLCKGVIDW
ncbi:MAG: hypothetical protein LBT09_14760, partial [Planctomycetaceae bacterium]|nr:hypothetical protein [Planctomycetaceae bacterium]